MADTNLAKAQSGADAQSKGLGDGLFGSKTPGQEVGRSRTLGKIDLFRIRQDSLSITRAKTLQTRRNTVDADNIGTYAVNR
jgi:hypothetical protein